MSKARLVNAMCPMKTDSECLITLLLARQRNSRQNYIKQNSMVFPKTSLLLMRITSMNCNIMYRFQLQGKFLHLMHIIIKNHAIYQSGNYVTSKPAEGST